VLLVALAVQNAVSLNVTGCCLVEIYNVPNERATYLQEIWLFYPEYDHSSLLGNLCFLRIPPTSCGIVKCLCLVP